MNKNNDYGESLDMINEDTDIDVVDRVDKDGATLFDSDNLNNNNNNNQLNNQQDKQLQQQQQLQHKQKVKEKQKQKQIKNVYKLESKQQQQQQQKQSIFSCFKSFLTTLGGCFELLCFDCCYGSSAADRKEKRRRGKYGKLPTVGDSDEPMTRVRLGFQGKDMWIETKNLNFHQTFGRYCVLMDEKDRIIPFTKNGELVEPLDPNSKYKIVANCYGTDNKDKWKQFKETEKIKMAKLQKPQIKQQQQQQQKSTKSKSKNKNKNNNNNNNNNHVTIINSTSTTINNNNNNNITSNNKEEKEEAAEDCEIVSNL
ncbi:hypothetical protein PPL_02023 [Heterostelium album PN500]|uniref:Uncharacterized protein n=1 Tax=Heterostelium pallidum (strain ATCC 26659 / Pp 5 / PN500) TaxID=670386 RepID=D3B153_HETP5|nr:hypothetical protein PPL_02023 [Heterostelium album PN500]EFA85027.1 hypothetical protein PPL_02023 [Heterostelium album PN500]|eukprot:XP_020437137.1 hypothetical protein PPL_02023 [Heterostelium album PN500]